MEASLDGRGEAASSHLAISGLDFTQLNVLRGRIEERVRAMRETEGPALRERFVQEAAAIGLTIEEIAQAGAKRRGRPSKDKEDA